MRRRDLRTDDEGVPIVMTSTAVASDVMTVPDVAALLRVSKHHVYNEVSRGRIPHRRVGSAIRFSRRLVIAWFENSK